MQRDSESAEGRDTGEAPSLGARVARLPLARAQLEPPSWNRFAGPGGSIARFAAGVGVGGVVLHGNVFPLLAVAAALTVARAVSPWGGVQAERLRLWWRRPRGVAQPLVSSGAPDGTLCVLRGRVRALQTSAGAYEDGARATGPRELLAAQQRFPGEESRGDVELLFAHDLALQVLGRDGHDHGPLVALRAADLRLTSPARKRPIEGRDHRAFAALDERANPGAGPVRETLLWTGELIEAMGVLATESHPAVERAPLQRTPLTRVLLPGPAGLVLVRSLRGSPAE